VLAIFTKRCAYVAQSPAWSNFLKKKGNVVSRIATAFVTKLEKLLPAKVKEALPSHLMSIGNAERLQQGAQ
jgi:hypothetical protein